MSNFFEYGYFPVDPLQVSLVLYSVFFKYFDGHLYNYNIGSGKIFG